MQRNRRAFLLLAAFAVAGCHVRAIPFSTPPGFSVSKESVDGTLGKKQDVTLSDEDNHYIAAFRYELPAAGALIATAKPVNPQAQISVGIFSEGSGNEPIAKGEPGKKAEANDLQAGVYYVAVSEPWKDAVRTRVELRTVYKPQDPDAAQQACKTQGTARELKDTGSVEDSVDYSAQRRTCWWKVPLTSEGALAVKFDNNGANLSAELVPPQGAPEKIDPVAGLSKPDLAAGDYFIKVYANDAGDAGRYRLATSFKQGDTCKNGGPPCSLEGAEELKLPSDSKTADVDYAKSKQFHFYKANFKEKGKLTITFKVLQPPRGSKVAAYFMKTPDDEGDRISGTSVTKDIDQPGDFWIRVQAPDSGDYGKYAIATIFQPSNFIPADVVEIGRSPCLLTVSAGTNQGVRPGLGCTVMSASGQAMDSCVVDQTFPNLSKVKPANARCNVAPNAKVQISAQ
ncbi:MAG TPA: hypothetical protein VFA79_20170 [Myxococcales bacterium]|nr:hypothetical protein [Myxococcales bacterium]